MGRSSRIVLATVAIVGALGLSATPAAADEEICYATLHVHEPPAVNGTQIDAGEYHLHQNCLEPH